MNDQISAVRIDKWLWAARFFKTRQLAIKAIKNSQVRINGQHIKPASNIHTGDVVRLKRGYHELEVNVVGLAEKRGSATIAQSLYQETEASIAAAEMLKQQLASQPKIDIDRRKPDKRGVRNHRALKRGD